MLSSGSILLVTTHVSVNSRHMWTWKVSGGSPPSMRVVRAALALTPPPPATAAFTMSTPGFCARYRSNSAPSPAASPPVVHHEKISSRPAGAGLIPGTGTAAAAAAGVGTACLGEADAHAVLTTISVEHTIAITRGV